VKLVCGVVDRNGVRRVLAAESTPTLENIDDLAALTPEGSCDWGPLATLDGRETTATVILAGAAGWETAKIYAEKYAEDVVLQLGTDKMWILSITEIQKWLTENRKVA
jgi:hypothetical protein